MPFTPLHMGPGLIVKALLQGSFSLMVFGWTQILIDIEPLIVLLRGEGHVHGFTHTYFGATLVGALAALTGKHAATFGLHVLREKRFLPISWRVTIVSAFIGAYSHVFLDSIMHADVQPFAPFALNNPLLDFISIDAMNALCLWSFGIGTVLYFAISKWLGLRHWQPRP